MTTISWKRLAMLGLPLATAAGWLLHHQPPPATADTVVPTVETSSDYLVYDNRGGAPLLTDTFLDASSGSAFQFSIDDSTIDITAPFAIGVFKDATTTTLRVHDNGYLTFGAAGQSIPGNQQLPTDAAGNVAIAAPFWDDLSPKPSSFLYTETLGSSPNQTFVIEWSDFAHFDDQTASYTFEVVFFENKPGEVLFVYATMGDGATMLADGRSATVGVQSADRTSVVTSSLNQTGAISSGYAVDFDFDSDRDGLADSAEDRNRDGNLDPGETDPDDFDTDNGGVGDGGEVLIKSTDPNDGGDDAPIDADSDGLSNADEMILGTNALLQDTDADGVFDGPEVVTLRTNPLLQDTDGDLLTDFDETTYSGSDPLVADSDGGGENDGNEFIAGQLLNDGSDDSGGPLSAVRTAMAMTTTSRTSMSAGLDPAGNVHAVYDASTQTTVTYGMATSDGVPLIGPTELPTMNLERPRYSQVFPLRTGKVAVLWAQGSEDSRTIAYALIDPALDDQDGDPANPALNPDSPATFGNGIVLMKKLLFDNVHNNLGYTHLDASIDPQENLHLTFITSSFGSSRRVLYAKIKANGGGQLTPVTTLLEIDGQQMGDAPTHRSSRDRIYADANGRAHLLFAGFSGFPSFGGGSSDLYYARVGADGQLEIPFTKIVTEVNGHRGIHGIASTGNEIALFHTANVTSRTSSDMTFRRMTPSLQLIEQSLIDGPSVDTVAHFYQSADATADAQGDIGVIYYDRFNDEAMRLAIFNSSGGTIVAPTTLESGTGLSNNSRRGNDAMIATNPDRDRLIAAWRNFTLGEIRFVTADLSAPTLGVLALKQLTATTDGTMRVERTGSRLFGAEIRFVFGNASEDTLVVIRNGITAAADPGARVSELMSAEFLNPAATLGATFIVRLQLSPTFTGDPALVRMYQDESGTFVEIPTTVDMATTPPTIAGQASQLTTYGVFEPNSNVAFTSTPPTGATVGFTYNYAPIVTSSTQLSFSLPEAPAGMSIDPATGEISWAPAINQLGFNAVTIRAANGFTSAEQNYAIAVTADANTVPIFTSSPPTNGAVGVVYAYTPTVLDPDQGQSLSFSLFTAPMGMSVDAVSGALDWTPATDQTGNNPVSLIVNDGFTTASQVFSVFVGGPSDNVAPMFTSSPLLVALPDREYSYTAVAIDPDGQLLTYSLFTGPAGMTIDGTSGLLVWTPSEDDAGANAVSIAVTDGVSTTNQIFSINVEVDDDSGGCGCSTTGGSGGAGWMLWAVLALAARRKRLL